MRMEEVKVCFDKSWEKGVGEVIGGGVSVFIEVGVEVSLVSLAIIGGVLVGNMATCASRNTCSSTHAMWFSFLTPCTVINCLCTSRPWSSWTPPTATAVLIFSFYLPEQK